MIREVGITKGPVPVDVDPEAAKFLDEAGWFWDLGLKGFRKPRSDEKITYEQLSALQLAGVRNPLSGKQYENALKRLRQLSEGKFT